MILGAWGCRASGIVAACQSVGVPFGPEALAKATRLTVPEYCIPCRLPRGNHVIASSCVGNQGQRPTAWPPRGSGGRGEAMGRWAVPNCVFASRGLRGTVWRSHPTASYPRGSASKTKAMTGWAVPIYVFASRALREKVWRSHPTANYRAEARAKPNHLGGLVVLRIALPAARCVEKCRATTHW